MQIASELARSLEAGGHVGLVELPRQLGGQQRDLHALREAQLLLEPLFTAPHLLVQPRILDRHGRLAGQQRQQLLVFLGERIQFGALEIEDTDAPIFDSIGITSSDRASSTQLM